MTEEEQKLWVEISIEIMSEKHKESLMKTKSSKAWTVMSSNARAAYPVILLYFQSTFGEGQGERLQGEKAGIKPREG